MEGHLSTEEINEADFRGLQQTQDGARKELEAPQPASSQLEPCRCGHMSSELGIRHDLGAGLTWLSTYC